MRRLLRPWVVVAIGLASLLPAVGFSYRFRFELIGQPAFGSMAVALLLGQLSLLALIAWRRPDADLTRVAFVVAALVLAFASFQAWTGLLLPGSGEVVRLGAWCLMAALMAWGVWRLADRAWFRWGAALFVGVLVVGQAGSLVAYRLWLSGAETPELADPLPPPAGVPAERPDVWWFVLDMMARPDQAAARSGVDVASSLAALEDDGFVVAEDSWVSYPRTNLSISSTLAMDYPYRPGADLRNEFAVSVPVIVDDNATFRRFHELGYEVGYVPAGSTHWTHCGAGPDVCVEPAGGFFDVDDLTVAMVELTPVGVVDLFDAVRSTPGDGHRSLAAARDPERPLFGFVHILGPHGPARYAPDCSPLDRSLPADSLPLTQRTAHYATDYRCILEDMVRTADAIVAEDPDAIIIVQGDHGTRFATAWEPVDSWPDDDYVERLTSFDASRLPARCRRDEPEAQVAVNTFRVVFGCVERTRPALAPYRAFNWTYGDVDGMVEVARDRSTVQLGPSTSSR